MVHVNEQAENAGTLRTARLLCLVPEALFERALVLWRLKLWTVVLCEHTVALAVEDEDGVDGVERQVHHSEFERTPECFGVRQIDLAE